MASISASAETIEVKTLKYAGPYAVAQPWMADSVNKGEAFKPSSCSIRRCFTLLNKGKEVTAAQLVCQQAGIGSIWLLSAFLTPSALKTTVAGLEQYRLFVDGEQVEVNGDKAETDPSSFAAYGCHRICLYPEIASPDQSLKLTVTAAKRAPLSVGDATVNMPITSIVHCAPTIRVFLSPNGKFIVVRKT